MAGTEGFLYHDAVGSTKRQTTSDFKHNENFMNLKAKFTFKFQNFVTTVRTLHFSSQSHKTEHHHWFYFMVLVYYLSHNFNINGIAGSKETNWCSITT